MGNAVLVDPDDLRKYHPHVDEFRATHPYKWSGLTQEDAGQWAGKLLDSTVSAKKNLIFDTTLSNGEWASEFITDLQARGYDIEVRVVAANRLESEWGVDHRFTERFDGEGVSRYVPEGAREAIYGKLPGSLDTIHSQTDVPIRIFNREGAELYDSRIDTRQPGMALDEEREARLKDPKVTRTLSHGWQEQRGWHEELPESVHRNPKVSPDVAQRLLAERDELKVADGVSRYAAEARDVDFAARIRPNITKGLGAVGVAATAYDALTTASRAYDLHEQGSVLASQSQLTHFAARNVGGWAGAAAGAAIGWETGPGVVAFAAVGAISTSAAGEKIADWWDQQKIYRQTDRDGVDWKFNGRQWLRQEQADLVDDGVDAPQRQAFAALPGKANELNYRATLAAVDLAASQAPEPKDPYQLPASERDRPSLRTADWRHDPVTGEWHRNVATGLNPHNDRAIYEPETASPQRAAQLDQQAATIIAGNIANGPAARAARVDQAYRVNNWQEFGPLPENLRAALSDPDTLTASDGKRYQRDADGNWSHDGRVAEGNRKLELEATRAVLQPALAQHAEAMAAVHARAPLSPQEQERVNLATTYASFGIKPNADTMEAVLLAVQRTRESHGIDATTTSLAPQPNSKGAYDAEGALGHLRTDADGIVRVAAMTSREDIRNALEEVRLQKSEERGIQNPAPVTTIGSRGTGGREPQVAGDSPAPARGAHVLADNPAHPDFDTFNRIHTWVRGTGQWDEEKSRNVASALYRKQAGDPLVKRVDKVVGGVGRDGAENVFAVYAPFGNKEPFFHANVDGREASHQPAQQSLEQAEQTKQQQQVQPYQQEQTAQQDRQAQRGAQMSM
jgi:hypothetical protein